LRLALDIEDLGKCCGMMELQAGRQRHLQFAYFVMNTTRTAIDQPVRFFSQ